MKKVKRILCIMMLCLSMSMFVGCNEADKVSQNLSKEEDNFNVVKEITVINCLQGDVLFFMQ